MKNLKTKTGEPLSLFAITKFKTVKMNRNNFWLLEALYGDCGNDRTAKFQVPNNIEMRSFAR